MREIVHGIGFNATPTTLSREVVITGKKVDPFSGGLWNTNSSFTIRPEQKSGIFFRIDDTVIPYDSDHLNGIDSPLGRMLKMENGEKSMQIVLVEHLLSAIQLLGLTDIEIVLDKSSYGPLTSKKFPIFGLGKSTHWIPVLGPGISGFVEQLSPHCVPLERTPEIVEVKSKLTHSILDPNPRYKGIKRVVTFEPADRLIIRVESAQQPDIKNNPHAETAEVFEGQNIRPFLRARPIMRLRSKFEEAVLFILNLRSFALTRETYFRSRTGMTVKEVVARMNREFQISQNEHLYHTAVSDFPAELGAFLRGRHLRALITLHDTNHVFRMNGLRQLMPQILGE